MPGRFTVIADSFNHLVDAGLAHWLTGIIPSREYILPASGKLVDFFQQLFYLAGYRYDMRSAHLHPFCRYIPDTFVKIDISPFRSPEFDCAQTSKHQQASGVACDYAAGVVVQRTKKGWYLIGKKMRKMLLLWCFQRTGKINHRVMLGPTRNDSIGEDLPAGLTSFFELIKNPPLFHLAQNGQHVHRLMSVIARDPI